MPDNGFSINPGKENQERVVDEIVAREIELETQREDAARRRMPMQARLLDKFTKNELQEMTESTKFREFKKLIAEDMGIEYVSEDEVVLRFFYMIFSPWTERVTFRSGGSFWIAFPTVTSRQ